ncbi:unnamed protein product [Protopolystoma xenopodis]|uniref:Uncharacterized protein n=1 Tax=Protopolystoma xenopodis TaxID=117903 RepID=A0A3S5FC10_9PLAT|nr:unnamed protein product [Protopolystoma xenopodis]
MLRLNRAYVILLISTLSFFILLLYPRAFACTHINAGLSYSEKNRFRQTLDFHEREECFHEEKLAMLQRRLDQVEAELSQMRDISSPQKISPEISQSVGTMFSQVEMGLYPSYLPPPPQRVPPVHYYINQIPSLLSKSDFAVDPTSDPATLSRIIDTKLEPSTEKNQLSPSQLSTSAPVPCLAVCHSVRSPSVLLDPAVLIIESESKLQIIG